MKGAGSMRCIQGRKHHSWGYRNGIFGHTLRDVHVRTPEVKHSDLWIYGTLY
jgi:hypothetical protein